MYRDSSIPELRPVTSIHIAVGTFVLVWLVWFLGLTWGNSGTMPDMLMAVFNLIYVDILYRPVWEVLVGVLPVSAVGFYTASTIGYALLSLLVGAWFHVLILTLAR